MASLGSFIRSAARATSSAYRRLPIRWRLAGGSAALTLVILCGFAVIVGVLTTRRIQSDFNRQVAERGRPAGEADPAPRRLDATAAAARLKHARGRTSTTYARAQNAAIRVVTEDDPIKASPERAVPRAAAARRTLEFDGCRVESRPVHVDPLVGAGVRPVRAAVCATSRRPPTACASSSALGVLGGAALALLAGLATARRAMAPIAELTETARHDRAHPRPVHAGSRTRRPRTRSPSWRGRWTAMLARARTARARRPRRRSTRQREFVADASHELRTPLTSVLANLELLEEVLDGRAAGGRGLGAALVAAHAPPGRATCCCSRAPTRAAMRAPRARRPRRAWSPRRPASSSRSPAATRSRSPRPAGAIVGGARDELHRLVLNLMENALRHTDPGHRGRGHRSSASTARSCSSVEDDGPGIPPELHDKVFERFFRGAGDRSRLVGPRALDRARRRRVAPRHRDARGPARRPRGALRRAPARRSGLREAPERRGARVSF